MPVCAAAAASQCLQQEPVVGPAAASRCTAGAVSIHATWCPQKWWAALTELQTQNSGLQPRVCTLPFILAFHFFPLLPCCIRMVRCELALHGALLWCAATV